MRQASFGWQSEGGKIYWVYLGGVSLCHAEIQHPTSLRPVRVSQAFEPFPDNLRKALSCPPESLALTQRKWSFSFSLKGAFDPLIFCTVQWSPILR